MRSRLLALVLVAGALPAVAADVEGFARCLTDRGAVFYGAVWCGHCQAQRRMFGPAFRHVTYVECSDSGSSADQRACREAGVSSFPTWTFKRGRANGRLSFEQLASYTGCRLDGSDDGSSRHGGVTDLSGRGVQIIEVP